MSLRQSLNRRRCADHAIRIALAATVLIGLQLAPEAAHAKKKGAWSVLRTVDPITGRQTCAVSALDRFGGLRFTRFGILYAVVENNPEAGLLVGVSSGGRWRSPVGDIVWRVDYQPYRTLRVVDNPKVAGQDNPVPLAAEAGLTGNVDAAKDAEATPGASTAFAEAYSKTVKTAMDQQSAAVAALTATATMASGETAQAMLAEMRAGKHLLFRSQAATPLYGMPSANVYAVGRDTLKGRKPIPIDQSLRDGLVACGILSQ